MVLGQGANPVRRREFIRLFTSTVVAWPLAARAQQGGKKYVVGRFNAGSATDPLSEVLTEALRELGWVEGENVVYERRYAENRVERLPEMATDLVRLNVDVIVAGGTLAPLAAKRATSTIPIVMAIGWRCIGGRTRGQPSATGRKHHRDEHDGAGPCRQTARIAERYSARAR